MGHKAYNRIVQCTMIVVLGVIVGITIVGVKDRLEYIALEDRATIDIGENKVLLSDLKAELVTTLNSIYECEDYEKLEEIAEPIRKYFNDEEYIKFILGIRYNEDLPANSMDVKSIKIVYTDKENTYSSVDKLLLQYRLVNNIIEKDVVVSLDIFKNGIGKYEIKFGNIEVS